MEVVDIKFYSVLVLLVYLIGIVLAIMALWRSRTPQGTTAWVMALISMPFVSIPAFLVFSRNQFKKYKNKRRKFDKKIQNIINILEKTYSLEKNSSEDSETLTRLAHTINQPGFIGQNSIDLLVDGESTYQRMKTEIDKAQKYILFQFYIFRDDKIGQLFKELLIKKAREGVKVYFLCDQVGTRLGSKFIKELETEGIKFSIFRGSESIDSKIQLNFRNHRKIIVIDSVISFLGGLNVGDDYLGKYDKIGPWRDTHMVIAGPATIATQVSFIKDWFWATKEVLDLTWSPTLSDGTSEVMVLHTGPADESEAVLLAYLSLINSAKNRLWISNPYFVPSEGLVNALALSAQRGVDVRIIIPLNNDNKIVQYASQAYVEKLTQCGVNFYRYSKGFTHQKVLLVDNKFSLVGSANFDSRSLFINYEVQAITTDLIFNEKMNLMFLNDFKNCDKVFYQEFEKQGLFKQFLVRAANLLSPML